MSSVCSRNKFQSALPVWGATIYRTPDHPDQGFQSALPVWGATLFKAVASFIDEFQSALPVWGATPTICYWNGNPVFQSALPVWGATPGYSQLSEVGIVSIRAPRVGSDGRFTDTADTSAGFNPRSPCGERPSQKHIK